jgi:hypothetical protein
MPPAICAQYAEHVPMLRGRLDRTGIDRDGLRLARVEEVQLRTDASCLGAAVPQGVGAR